MSRAPKWIRKPRFLLVYPLAAWMFLFAETTEWSLRIGIALIALGEVLRIWANGYVGDRKVNIAPAGPGAEKIGRLTTAGPYRYVRHPLYLGSLLIGTGFSVITGRWWFAASALVLLVIVYARTIEREEATLRHEWGETFDRYQRAVPRLLPTWRRYPEGSGQWRRQGILASQEWKTCLWVIVLVIALYFREEVLQEHEFWVVQERLKQGLLLGLAGVLMAGDLLFELFKPRPRPTH